MFCFVIMPYGGQNDEKRKHYLGVYNQIIRAAAIEAGFDPADIKRSDIADLPGNILTDIIQDLYKADIVIADLTEQNPNVFWELGVRHALRKSGTVAIIDADHKIPFDLGQYRTIQYSTKDLGSISDVVTRIAECILKRLETADRSDNAVHDVIPELPISFSALADDTEIDLLKERLTQLTRENDRLVGKLAQIDPSGTLGDEDLDVAKMIDEATEIQRQTGGNLILSLASAQADGEEAFLAELKRAINNPFLSISDFLQIRTMCKELGLEHHQRTVLEIASKRFPYDDTLKLALIDSYDDAESFNLQERGRLMIEEFLGIQHTDSGPVITNKSNATRRQAVGLLFNFYLRARRDEWVISAADSVEASVGPSSILSRNKARALARLGSIEDAEKEYERAMELDPNDDTTYLWYGDFLDDRGQYEEAYELMEKAVLLDPEDGSRYLALANHVLFRGVARLGDGKIVSGLHKSERIRVAIPLLTRGLEITPDPRLQARVVNLLVNEKALKEASAISKGVMPPGDFITDALDYLEQQTNGNVA